MFCHDGQKDVRTQTDRDGLSLEEPEVPFKDKIKGQAHPSRLGEKKMLRFMVYVEHCI